MNLGEIPDIAMIGTIEDLGLEVFVKTDDENVEPHVHIWDRTTRGEKFHTCVKLLTPEYFPHGDKYNDVFSSEQKKAFAKFMESIDLNCKEDLRVEITVYEVCCWLWNMNNSSVEVEVCYYADEPIIPDYSQL